jgi:16S rRNA (guanine527-N7)-methyltransferase
MQSPAEILRSGLVALGEDAVAHPQSKYLAYLALLQRWSRAYNLTGIRDPARMVSHHVLDSLSLLPYLQGVRCLDVGSGAGLPGLILALARPRLQWVLLDSNGKKARFLRECVCELDVQNAEVVQARAESWRPERSFDTIVSRAFGSLEDLHGAAARLLAERGVLLAMKGPDPSAEITTRLRAVAVVEVIPVQVPGVEGGRTVVRMRERQL